MDLHISFKPLCALQTEVPYCLTTTKKPFSGAGQIISKSSSATNAMYRSHQWQIFLKWLCSSTPPKEAKEGKSEGLESNQRTVKRDFLHGRSVLQSSRFAAFTSSVIQGSEGRLVTRLVVRGEWSSSRLRRPELNLSRRFESGQSVESNSTSDLTSDFS